MAEELNESVMIEGFDPSKMVDQEQDHTLENWKEIYAAYQNSKILYAPIAGIEKIGQPGEEKHPCAVVRVGTIRGLIPLEYTGAQNLRQLRSMTGQNTAFMVLNYDQENELFTASRTKAREKLAAITLRKLQVGDTTPAVIRHVDEGYLLADIGGIHVVIPIDEIRYGWIDNLHDEFQEGQAIKVKVMAIDEEKQHVEVSAKALLQNPWPDCVKRYQKNGEYVGTVSGVREYGVFVRLEPGVDSLSSHLKFQNVQKDDRVLVRVDNINTEKEQIRTRITRVL
ncbi:S1 RNA-binding domain-containing protein [Lentibacillus cibarius]|uniref:30S ribosomal protein S1 n=1 Tax=Lentibacillus cibarius TaxID=2583219 RepID=A0A5S3QI99_9BACI|nr:S1 RNA-binding domain-containing protein [Lentibacillus cibarius]TMN20931.1 30S ribosomal protein S1 [Lentibacillus cibarius]